MIELSHLHQMMDRPVSAVGNHTASEPFGNSAKPIIHFRFLDGLRGSLALYVAAFHFLAFNREKLPHWMGLLQKPVAFGHVAVAVFIVLSGFSLMLPVVRSDDRRLRGGAVGYLKRRGQRILPGYYAAFILAVIVQFAIERRGFFTEQGGVRSLALHLLLLQNFSRVFMSSYNMAHWSVAVEWQIYFFLPFLLLPVWRKFGVVGMVVVAGIVSAAPLILLPRKWNLAWSCPWYLLLFAIGALSATLNFEKLKRYRLIVLLMLPFAALSYLAIHFSNPQISDFEAAPQLINPYVNFSKDLFAGLGIAMALIYLCCSLLVPRRSVLLRVLESPMLVYLGASSYSLYLTHCSVLDLSTWCCRAIGWTDARAFLFRGIVAMPFSVLFAIGFARVFERPFVARRLVIL